MWYVVWSKRRRRAGRVRGLGQVGSGWVSSGPGTAAWLCAVRELALASGVWRLAWRRRWVRAAGWDQLELEWLRLADLQPGSSDIQHSGSRIQHPASRRWAAAIRCRGAWAHGSAASSSSKALASGVWLELQNK
jgi:hypothetical protein